MNGPPDNRGCNLRALHDLFVKSRERRQDGIVDTIKVSVLEIYNESIRDLLRDPSKGAKKLEVRRGERGNYVPDLTSVEVHDDAEVIELMEMADGVRAASSTDMNEHSSRSHMLLSVYVDTVHGSSAARTFGRLHLAGPGAASLDDDAPAIVAPRHLPSASPRRSRERTPKPARHRRDAPTRERASSSFASPRRSTSRAASASTSPAPRARR